MDLTSEPRFRASVTQGHRHHLPDFVPESVVLHVAALGPGWCELTTDAVPLSLFAGIIPRTRRRLILPTPLQPWFRGGETTQIMCLVSGTGSSIDVLLADVRHVRQAFAEGAATVPLVHRWARTPSPWRPEADRAPDAVPPVLSPAPRVATGGEPADDPAPSPPTSGPATARVFSGRRHDLTR